MIVARPHRHRVMLVLLTTLTRAAAECNPRNMQMSQPGTTTYCDPESKRGHWNPGSAGNCYEFGSNNRCECKCYQGVGDFFKCGSEFDAGKDCFLTTLQCQPCYPGTARVGCGCTSDLSTCASGSCVVCADGEYSSGRVGDYCRACTECAQGEYASVPCSGAADTVCETCPIGSYCPTVYEAIRCPVGSYCPYQSTAPIQCVEANGELCRMEGLMAPFKGCPAGKKLISSQQSPTYAICVACDAGKYSDTTATLLDGDCQPCAKCTYQPDVGQTQCLSCDARSETSVSSGATSCTLCPAGKYYVAEHCDRCQSCPDGTQNSIPGSLKCDVCAAGEYVLPGKVGCGPCPVGTYGKNGVNCIKCDYRESTFKVMTTHPYDSDLHILFNHAKSEYPDCNVCPQSTYRNFSAVEVGEYACLYCPPGFYCFGVDSPPYKCLPQEQYPPDHYLLLPCNAARPETLISCRKCGYGEYEYSPCTLSSNRICKACTVCSQSDVIQFDMTVDVPCSANADATCHKCNASDVEPGKACNPCALGTTGVLCAELCPPNTFGVGGVCHACAAGKTSGRGAGACTVNCSSAAEYAPDGVTCQALSTAEREVVAWDPVVPGYSAFAPLPPLLGASGDFLAAWSPLGLRGQLMLVGKGIAWTVAGNSRIPLSVDYPQTESDGLSFAFGEITSLTVGPSDLTSWTALVTEAGGAMSLVTVSRSDSFMPWVRVSPLTARLERPVDSLYMGDGLFLVLAQTQLFEVTATGVSPNTEGEILSAPSAVTGVKIGMRWWILVLDTDQLYVRSATLLLSGLFGMQRLWGSAAAPDDLASTSVGQIYTSPTSISLRYATDLAIAGDECWLLIAHRTWSGAVAIDFQSEAPRMRVASVVPYTEDNERPLRFSSVFGASSLYLAMQGSEAEIARLSWQGGCQCDPGLYSFQGQCVQSPAASFTEGWATAPIPCAQGYGGIVVGAQSAAAACLRCPPGFTTMHDGSAMCIRSCPPGQFYNMQTGACADGCNASLGLYLDLDTHMCLRCWLGSEATDGVTGPESCTLCTYDWYGVAPGICARCAEGTTTFDQGATLCMPLNASLGADGSALPAKLKTSLNQASSLSVASGGDALYVGSSSGLTVITPSATREIKGATYELVQVDESNARVFHAGKGGSCVFVDAKRLAGDCALASRHGTGLLGAINSIALVEIPERTAILYASSVYEDGCAAIHAISTFDGSVQAFTSDDPMIYPPIFLPCGSGPLLIASSRSVDKLYVAFGSKVFVVRTTDVQPTALVGTPLLQTTKEVRGLSAQPNWPLMVVLASGELQVYPASVMQGSGQAFVATSVANCSGPIASTGRRAWVVVNNKTLAAVERVSSNCVGGFIKTESGLCMQAGIGHVVLADGGLLLCPIGTFGNRSGAYSLTHCVTCPDGKIAALPGATQCVACSAGEVANADSTECLAICTAGSYLGRPGQCVSCGAGFTSPPGQTSPASCMPCQAGQYSNRSSGGLCVPCPDGFASLPQSDHCVVRCAVGECAADGKSCVNLNRDYAVLTQIAMSGKMVSIAVDTVGEIFYTDGTVIQHYFDDCPAVQQGNCVKQGENLVPSFLSTGYTFSALAVCSRNSLPTTIEGCETKRALYAASITYNSIYRLDVCFNQGRVNHLATRMLAMNGLTLVAGSGGSEGFRDGPLLQARFNQPIELELTSDCSAMYISDFFNHRVRRLDFTSGMVTTILGNGLPCSAFGSTSCTGDSNCEEPTCASIERPTGLGLSEDDRDLYVSMNTQSRLGVIRNVQSTSNAFEYSCSFSQTLYKEGSQPMCDIGNPDSKSCPLYRPFDVVSFEGNLYMGVTQGIAQINQQTNRCDQISGKYFGIFSMGLIDGVGATTPSGLLGFDTISSVKVPFRLAVAKGTGVLYFADLQNGAIRRVLVKTQCACPAGRALVAGANSCYDATPVHDIPSTPPCKCGLFALPGDTICFRNCSTETAYGSFSASPCLSQQACWPSQQQSNLAARAQITPGSSAPGWTYAQVEGNPQPNIGPLADWYGVEQQGVPTWDAIFAQRSSVRYKLGGASGRAPYGREYISLTYRDGCWMVDNNVKATRLLPGLWYPCVEGKCAGNVGAFGMDDDPTILARKTWYSARWMAVNGGARAMLPGAIEDFVAGGGDPIHLWSRFVISVSQRCGEWTDEGGPCFEGWRHVAQSPPLTLDGLKADSAEDIGRGSFMGWPAQYACPNGYIWTPPANISMISSSLCSTRLTSQIACVSCLAGSYSFIDDDQKNITGGPYRCVQCETGFYSSTSGSGGCLPCPNNTYAATSGATACTACPAGKTTNRIGAWAAELCYVCPSGTGDCGSCRLGEYQLKMGQVYCLLTPPGTYSSTLNAIAPTPCSPGTFQANAGRSSCTACDMGAFSDASATACKLCSVSSVCPLVVKNTCGLGCGFNKYWDTNQCVTCPLRSINQRDWCALGVDACKISAPPRNAFINASGTLQLCPDGKQASLDDNFLACVACPNGTFSRNAESTFGCQPCPNGTYGPLRAQSSCVACPVGTYSQKSGAVACRKCSPGFIAPSAGSGGCQPCAAGMQAPGEGRATCNFCQPGFFSNESASSECIYPCAAAEGMYVAPGATQCAECVGGTVGVSRECTPCGLGMYEGLSLAGEPKCFLCPVGKVNLFDTTCQNQTECCLRCPSPTQYADLDTRSVCYESPAGSMPLPDGTGFALCSPGLYRDPNMTLCAPCPPGSFASDAGRTSCSACIEGYFAEASGQSECSPCPPSTVALTTGAVQCSFCPAGYEGYKGHTCMTCGNNTFSTGAGPCQPCPGDTVSYGGAKNCSECPDWTFFDRFGTGKCARCPPGRYMSGPTTRTCNACPLATYLAVSGGNDLANCSKCQDGLVAPLVGQSACTSCAPGSVGVQGLTCKQCPVGKYANNGSLGNCTLCREGSYAARVGTANCTLCPPGTYTSQNGASSCTPCPLGTYAGRPGMSQCEPCTLTLGFSNTTGLAACWPRQTKCEPGYFVTVASSTDSDNSCARCMPCDDTHLAAYQQPGGTEILLLTSSQIQKNAVAMKIVCPGDTTAPLFFCVPSVLPAGWKLVYNSLANRAGGSSTGTGAVDPYVQSQCPALSTLEASLAAYVVGPSISQCFVGCRYNISSTGVTQYRTQSQAWSSSSENATANIFNAQMLTMVQTVCLPCPKTPCTSVIGAYRPFVETAPDGSLCGPPCLIPGTTWATACAAHADGCVNACDEPPANAFFISGAMVTGASRNCSWQCVQGYHINAAADGCDPCDLQDDAAAIVALCGGTKWAMRPPSQCIATDTRVRLCIECVSVPYSFQPKWDPLANQCVYPCYPGYFFEVINNAPVCVPCDGPVARNTTCAVGSFLDLGSCSTDQLRPTCKPCALSTEGYSDFTTSFTTDGGTNAHGCRAICRVGFHTTSNGVYYDLYNTSMRFGPLAVNLSCVRCRPDDGRSCVSEMCFPGYWRVPSIADGQPGSCKQCMTNDLCAAGTYAIPCRGNETADSVCKACPQSLLADGTRQFVPYSAQYGPNRNRVMPVSGNCPTACVNNYVTQTATGGQCLTCASLVRGNSTCLQLNGQPRPCNFVFSHWNATPGLPWWPASAMPSWMAPQVARWPNGKQWQRAGLCWACPFGTATTSADQDLCVILPGFALVGDLPPAKFPIPSLPEDLTLVFNEPRQAIPMSGRQLLSASTRVVDARRMPSTPRFYRAPPLVPWRSSVARSPVAPESRGRRLLQDDAAMLLSLDEGALSPNATDTDGAAVDEIGACPFGSYKPMSGVGPCLICPSYTSTVDSAAIAPSQCLCRFGHYRARGQSCSPCPADTFAIKPGATVCTPCPANETTFGRSGQSACACKDGLIRQANGKCTLCPAGFYCLPCYDGDAQCPRVVPCFGGATSPPGSVSVDSCVCKPGEVRLRRPTQAQILYYCSALPVGAVVSAQSGRVVCGAGWMAVAYASDGITAKECALCPAGHYAETSPDNTSVALLNEYQQPNCLPCPSGTYSGSKAAVGAQCCLACPAPQITNAVAATSITNCSCPAGMGKTPDGGCTGCTPQQFRAAATNQCVDCPLHAIAIPGAVSVEGCACAPGYQLMSSACVECPVGTFSPVTSNAPCMQCPAGSTTLNSGSTTWRACGASSSLCLVGYVWRQGIGCFKT